MPLFALDGFLLRMISFERIYAKISSWCDDVTINRQPRFV